MTTFSSVWCCECGQEYDITGTYHELGTLFKCDREEGCQQVFAKVYAKGGPSVWIHVDEEQVKFHRLWENREEET